MNTHIQIYTPQSTRMYVCKRNVASEAFLFNLFLFLLLLSINSTELSKHSYNVINVT